MFSVTFLNITPNYKNIFWYETNQSSKQYISSIFLWPFDPIIGCGLPLWGFTVTLNGNTALSTTPVDQLSAHSRHIYMTTNTALSTTPVDQLSAHSRHIYMTTNNSHKRQTSMSRRDSNPHSSKRPSTGARLTLRWFWCIQTIYVPMNRNK